ncbi:hypothetical protein [Hymenobacter sp. APR13]|uniref:hypothetical protein n=1 Tax=Hymenobacter sp. APR13 TaxID=1356852 RepID=UPI0004E05157|nr:hypothetical protein [Hymenobacter sp. APR13]AII51974.1 hypothetical protein N008_08285 [Hymenobacter sp. APR13]
MTLTSPPNHLHTLNEQDAVPQRYLRRISPIVGYIVLLLLLLYVLYTSQMPVPVSKRKSIKKPWYISQGFFHADGHHRARARRPQLSEPARAKPGCIGTGRAAHAA